MKIKKAIITALFTCVVYSIINAPSASADGWAGSGGGLGNACSENDYSLTTYKNGYGLCTYNGYGWVYYKYTSAAKEMVKNGQSVNIVYGPASNNSGGVMTIPSECVSYGGFWHFGIYAYKEIGKTSSLATGSGSLSWTRMNIHGYGAFGNPKYGGTGSNAIVGTDEEDKRHNYNNYNILADGVYNSHKFFKNDDPNTKLAYSDHVMHVYDKDARAAYKTTYGVDPDVVTTNLPEGVPPYLGDVYGAYQDFRRIHYVATGEYDRQWDIADRAHSTITAFCARESNDIIPPEGGATFEGSVTPYVGGSERASGEMIEVTDGNPVALKFIHKITRTDDNPLPETATSKWSTSVRSEPNSTPRGTAISNQSTNFKIRNEIKKVREDPFSVTVAEGKQVKYCQTLTYSKTVNKDNTTTEYDTAEACVTLYRKLPEPPTTATFEPKISCSVVAAGIAKSNSCNSSSDTNSKNWSISHTSWVKSNNSDDVNAGKIGSSTSPYAHGNLDYGVDSTQCVRSHGAYTYYWRYIDSIGGDRSTSSDHDETLTPTQEQDLPLTAAPLTHYDGTVHPDDPNYHKTGRDIKVGEKKVLDPGTHDVYHSEYIEYDPPLLVPATYKCVYVGLLGGGTYNDSSCTTSSTGIWGVLNNVYALQVDVAEHYEYGYTHSWTTQEQNYHMVDVYGPEWAYYVNGCDGGKTYWYKFDSKSSTKTWSNSDDSGLLLGNSNDKVTINRCSAIEVVPNYNNYSWNGSATASSCNQITRWRRYAHFNANTLGIKADPKNLSAATTARNNGDTVDTTNDDGKFTVTFTYSLNRGETDNWKDGESSKNFKVKNRWSSMETVSAADGSNITYLINGSYNDWHEYGTFESTNANTTNASGTKTETITGQLYYGQKIKICGNLSYGDVVKETDSGSKRSHIIEQDAPQEVGCIYISRGESNCSNVVGDNPSATGYGFGHKTGYNVAKIGVLNASIGMTTPSYTSWSYNQSLLNVTGSIESSVGVWARPGDSIRYQVQYCMGANYSHAVHALNGISDGGVDTKMHMNGDSTARTTAETNKLNAAQRSNYLFGDTVGTYSGTTKSTTPITFNFMKYNNITGEGGDATEVNPESATIANNIGTKYSPDITSSTNLKLYSCPHGGGTDGYNNYYQIAGKVKRNGTYGTTDNYIIDGCGENRTQSLDVGRELSEQLIWTNERVNSATSMTVNGEYTHRAYVRVPYNYTAKPYLKNNSTPTGTVQIGGKMTTTPGIAVFPRKNCAFVSGYYTGALSQTACQNSTDSAATYATVTKPTTVKFETLLNGSIVAGSTKTMVVRGNTKSYRNGSKDVITSTESAGGPNLDSDYTIDVPNTAKAGDQVCIRMTITPADSHNSPTATTVWGASTSKTYAESTGSNDTVWWGLRESGDGIAYAQSSATVTTCSTAVKRPTISVEDSNLYTATSVATSVVARKNNNTQYLYGSWTEYGIFGKVITSSISDLGTLGMGSGASYGYNQTSFYANHSGAVSGYNPQPLTVVTYNGGPKNGVHNYNYGNVTSLTFQRRITYDYQRNDDGSRSYKLVSNGYVPIAPSYYVFASMPIVNAGNSIGSAPKNGSTICVHSTQTFANNNCDNGQVGTSGVGSDAAESFTTNLLAHYNTSKLKTSTVPGNATKYGDYVDITSANVPAGQIEGDENAAMYKYVKKAFLGYANGADIDLATLSLKQATPVEGYTLNQTVGSSIIYKADELVINSSIIANDDEKNNAGDFRMPIIIAGKVWLTGNPTRIDAIIITNELNTCKWNSFDDFRNSPSAGTVSMSNLTSDTCNKTVRFTAPVVVKGKVILNRTAGAGQGDDQIRRAEIFELNPATYLWSYAEASRYSQAITTYSRELPSRY